MQTPLSSHRLGVPDVHPLSNRH